MNYIDAVCLFILVVYIHHTRRKGAVYMIISMFGRFISLTASYMYFGTVSGFLRGTPLFGIIKNQVLIVIMQEGLLDNSAPKYIKRGGAMDFLDAYIMANDNTEIYKLFGVSSFADYIASYIANTIINVVSYTVIYFCISVIIGTLFKATGMLKKLPVIKNINAAFNIIAGFIQGTVVIWILMVVLMLFVLQGRFTDVYDALLSSKVAVYFLEYNILAKIIFKVMA